jgi:plastocyanin
MQRRIFTLIVVALVALGLAACSSSSKKSSTTSGGSTITAQDFSLTNASVKAGATVTVENKGPSTHTVTSDTAGQFDTGDIQPGKTGSFTAPSAPGTYPFHCNIHPTQMKGTLTVT